MKPIECYSYLFTDSLMGALLITPHKEFVYDVMMMFGGYDKLLMLFFACIGGVAGTIIDWLLGNILRSVRNTDSMIEKSPNYQLIQTFLQKLWSFPLLLTFLPFGSIVPVSYGLYRVNIGKMLLLLLPLRILMLLFYR